MQIYLSVSTVLISEAFCTFVVKTILLSVTKQVLNMCQLIL